MPMRLALRQPGQCAFCALKASTWSPLLLDRQDGARRHRTAKHKYKTPVPGHPRIIESRVLPVRNVASAIRNTELYNKGDRRIKKSAYHVFGDLVLEHCRILRTSLQSKFKQDGQMWGITTSKELDTKIASFTRKVRNALDDAAQLRKVNQYDNLLFYQLRNAFVTGHLPGMSSTLRYTFMASFIDTATVAKNTETFQQDLADLSHPLEWYPGTRAVQRTIHLHIGPTNSGKTYHALKRLEEASSGIYAGPLRLLAHEVYTRFNAKGKKCALITGEEHRIPEGLTHIMSSCTVEMVPLNAEIEVAVIDEIQMIGDEHRGWAWTQALLGVKAKEVHCCGETRTEPLMRSLCAAMGDKLIVHRYERLGPLKPEKVSLQGNLSNLQKGDAIILFSRLAIHSMKKAIEKATGRRCAVVYGSLPSETRAQQAALFNDPDNDYDFLVASNAVGMGLNLSIKRIIFTGTTKYNGNSHQRLASHEINQIAGRAGRFKSAQDAIREGIVDDTSLAEMSQAKTAPNVGLVTTYHDDELSIVTKAMYQKPDPMKTAGIFPPAGVITRFAAFFPPETPFSFILLRLKELTKLNPQFHLCDLSSAISVLDIIQPYRMPVHERISFMSAPINTNDPGMSNCVVELAQCLSNRTGGELLNLRSMDLEMLDRDIHDHPKGHKGFLRDAEALHKMITLYLWLSYRFAGVFRSQELAFHVNTLVEAKIVECLDKVDQDVSELIQRRKTLASVAMGQNFRQGEALEESDFDNEDDSEFENAIAEAAAAKTSNQGPEFSSLGTNSSSTSTEFGNAFINNEVMKPAGTSSVQAGV